MPVNTLIQVRRGSGEGWSNAPNQLGRGILYNGEIGYETNTGKFKIGDGTTSWDSLCYASVPINTDNFLTNDSINIVVGSNCGSATWSVDETWLAEFIANSSGSLNIEGVQDIIGTDAGNGGFLVNGTGIAWNYDDENNHLSVSVTGIPHTLITDWDAAISGNIDTQLVAGTGINFVYDSGNNTLTISTAVLDDSHTHIWDNITDAKVKASLTELGYLSGVVPGTAVADRVLVLDSSKDIDGIRNLTATDTITAVTFSGNLSGDVTSTGSSSFSDVDINGGSIDGTVIGANSAAVVSGTSVYASVGFVGDLTGNADSADQVKTQTASNGTGPYYLTFVDSNNNSATNETVYTDTTLEYNALTNILSLGGVSATGTVSADHLSSTTLITTGNVTVGGDLTVAGTTTTVNSTVVEIGDNIIRVNTSGLPTGGLEVRNSGTTDYKQLVWDKVDGRWEVGSENFQANRFISTVANGTAPFVVTSTTAVTNLNSDLLDGQHGSHYLDWGNFTNLPDPVITVNLTGDVSGSGSYTWTNLNGNPTINISSITVDSVQPNSVVLGTDTTGQYASTIGVAGTGLSVTTPAANDGTAYTITSNATPANTINTIVSRDASGNFSAGTITASLTGNASTATKLATARYIELTGDVVGSGLFDGSANIQISTTVEGAGTVTLANETSDTDNYLTFANSSTGEQALKTNVNIRFDAGNNKLLGTSSASTSPTSRLEYFIIDGGSP